MDHINQLIERTTESANDLQERILKETDPDRRAKLHKALLYDKLELIRLLQLKNALELSEE